MRIRDNKGLTIFSWALYDFANAIFAMNVVALYLALWVTVEKGAEDIVYSFTLGASMLIAAVCMPILGAMSDKGKRRMPYLILFTVICVIFLAFVGLTESLIAGLLFFAVANFGYLVSGAVFYNALLPEVADANKIGAISGYGICLSYLGTITGLFLIRPVALEFGYHATFIPTALLFLLFALPCFLFVKDRSGNGVKQEKAGRLIRTSFKELSVTLRYVGGKKELLNFFISIFIIINVLNAVFIFMSVYLKKVFYLSDADIMALYILSNIFSIAGALISGAVSDRIGARRTLIAAVMICAGGMLVAVVSPSKDIFWVVGPMIGLAFSSVRVSGRALAVELFPRERIGEVFGHLGFLSNLAFLGLLTWGGVVYAFSFLGSGKYRVSLFSLLLLLLIGLKVFLTGGDDVKRED